MAVIIINPNSTAAMTDAMVDTGRAAAPAFAIEGWTSTGGPPAIQGAEDGEAATPPLLRLVDKAAAAGADGIIIGCFDDTALAKAAQRAACPVIGIGQAAYHYCALRQWRFSVVTTLPVAVPIIEGNIAACGLSHHLARVRASNVPVLDLERGPESAAQLILNEAEDAIRQDGIDAIILGCAGMTKVVQTVRSALDFRIIDPVTAAIRCMGWLHPSLDQRP
ncbi:aspartate/glutamate racemase family protein [Aestuariibius sp. 2305UL40-4]|uniref:aspartate/glutamate racemase family protein n=1 Tax=Aestuariibius violaceus TaxID=3234132 RepID=UPI00345F0EC2